jgi:hypothetical protein
LDAKTAPQGVTIAREFTTQVLFFTHHQHLLDVAQKALGTSVATVTLPAAAAAVAAPEPAPIHSEAA